MIKKTRIIREDICWKKSLTFGHCPNGGGFTDDQIFWPFFYQVKVPKIGTFLLKSHNICKVFGHFFHHNHQNYHHYYQNYHCNYHYHHWYFFPVIRVKRRFDVRKKRGPSCPNWGAGGGVSLIWAIPESMRLFSADVFPYTVYQD